MCKLFFFFMIIYMIDGYHIYIYRHKYELRFLQKSKIRIRNVVKITTRHDSSSCTPYFSFCPPRSRSTVHIHSFSTFKITSIQLNPHTTNKEKTREMACILDQIAGVKQMYSCLFFTFVYYIYMLRGSPYSIFPILSVACFTLAWRLSPGKRDENTWNHRLKLENEDVEKAKLIESSSDTKICERCDLVSIRRSAHCSQCKTCVICQHHHCHWIENCVGLCNYKAYVYFLISSLLWSVQIHVYAFFVSPSETFTETLIKLGFECINLCASILLLSQIRWQWYLLSKNMTGSEELSLTREYSRASYFGVAQGKMRSIHVYDTGSTWRNVMTFLYGPKYEITLKRNKIQYLYIFLPILPSESLQNHAYEINSQNMRQLKVMRASIESKVNDGLKRNGLNMSR